MNAGLPSPSAPLQGREVDHFLLRDVLRVVVADWRVFAAVLLLSLSTGLAYYWATPARYEADALVQIEKKSRSITSSSDDLYDLMSGRDATSTEIALVKSRLVLGRVVDSLKLDIVAEPKYFPWLGRTIAHGSLSKSHPENNDQIDVASLDLPESLLGKDLTLRLRDENSYTLEASKLGLKVDGKIGEPVAFNLQDGAGSIFVREAKGGPGTEYRICKLHRLDVVRALSRDLQVFEQGRQSGILDVSLEGSDPSKITAIVNALATAYQRQNVERRSAEAEQTLSFVDEQLPRVRQSLEAAENALNRYRLAQKSADLTKETELVLQQSVSLEQRRVELEQKREEALRRFTANHPVIQGMDAQLEQIGEEQKHLAVRVATLPETQQELLRLSRDVTVNNGLYTTLLNNAEQLRLAKAGTIGNVRIVDFAERPYAPVRPSGAMVLALSSVTGIFLGLVSIFARRSLHAGVSDPAVLERAFGLTTFASIPDAPAQRRIARQVTRGQDVEGVLTRVAPHDLAVEAIRSLRTAVQTELSRSTSKTILICGPTSGVGKSFVSVNLSAALAMTGKRVVLIDADLRRGQLHQYFGQAREPGLADFVEGRQEALQAVIHKTPEPNFFIVPTGSLPASPAELLLSGRFDQAISQLAAEFDYVVVDSAPVLAVTDAIIASRVAGMILMVLRSGEHSVRQVEETIRRFDRGGRSIRAAIFNQVGGYKSDIYGATEYFDYSYRPLQK